MTFHINYNFNQFKLKTAFLNLIKYIYIYILFNAINFYTTYFVEVNPSSSVYFVEVIPSSSVATSSSPIITSSWDLEEIQFLLRTLN